MIVKLFEEHDRKRAELFHVLAISPGGELRIMDRAFPTAEYAAEHIANVYEKACPGYCRRWVVVKSLLDFSNVNDPEVQHAQHAAL